MSPSTDITELLADWSRGNREALSKLLPIVYKELHSMADGYLRKERGDHTLQATALVHEAYLKLVDQRDVAWQNRGHFFGVAAMAMRRILVNHAKAHRRLKRGGGAARVTLHESGISGGEPGLDLVALDEALSKLAEFDERKARLVELRFFGGLSIEETGEALGVSPATIKRDWLLAKTWLLREIKKGEQDEP